ncbi:MAG TPA: hypothetical protein PKM72_10100, partial [Nitrospirales bacterium]|nr:hypothetical protein [Nitrospirales bacterium]
MVIYSRLSVNVRIQARGRKTLHPAVQTAIIMNQKIDTPVLVVNNSSAYCPANELPFSFNPGDHTATV